MERRVYPLHTGKFIDVPGENFKGHVSLQRYLNECFGLCFSKRGNAKDWVLQPLVQRGIGTKVSLPKLRRYYRSGEAITVVAYGHIRLYLNIEQKQLYDQNNRSRVDRNGSAGLWGQCYHKAMPYIRP